MPELMSPGTAFPGMWGPDAILTSAGVPVTNTAVTVYESDGSTDATLYTVPATGSPPSYGSTTANPVSTDALGNLVFCAAPGQYVLSLTVGGVPTTRDVMVAPWYTDSTWNVVIDTGASISPNSGDLRLANCASNGITYTLPNATLGTRIKITKTDTSTNVVTITPPAGIYAFYAQGGNTSITLPIQGMSVEVFADGTNYWVVALNGGDSAWLVPSFQNSWVANSGSFVAYRRMGNIVIMRGSITTGSTGTVAFILPVGYRPIVNNRQLPAVNTVTMGEATIDTSGNVTINLTGGTNPTWLDAITFPID